MYLKISAINIPICGAWSKGFKTSSILSNTVAVFSETMYHNLLLAEPKSIKDPILEEDALKD